MSLENIEGEEGLFEVKKVKIWCEIILLESGYISKDIIFDLEKKIIHIEISYYDKKGNLLKIEGTLTLEELQAINKKVEELKWIDMN